MTFEKYKSKAYMIEAGNWCKRYENFINDKTVKKCKEEENMQPRGCPNCKYYTYKAVSKRLY
ncbi:hypothetical protein SAMN04324257_00149 [Thermoanaerobacter thermohydrosulfuricus]|nr:hypothetical protein SAMN04324257_00149 [Thermoanaerobacter thermohydrosulfuricus]